MFRTPPPGLRARQVTARQLDPHAVGSSHSAKLRGRDLHLRTGQAGGNNVER